MCDFDRTLEKIGENGTQVAYFVTVCHDCGATFRSRTIGKMPEWEHQHEMKCEALDALEA